VSHKTLQVLLAVVSVAAVVAVAAWHQTSGALNESRTRAVAGLLEPAAGLLKENQTLIKELQAEPFREGDAGILASYLAKIRRDGVAKNAQMKQRLDQLADNNTAIVALVSGHSPHAKTPAFTAEADKFRKYAAAWRDRWNSVMELFMAGGTYAAAEVPFPQGFPDTLQAEIAASR
jgi:hypothetical protein